MGNKSKRIPFALTGRKVVLVNRADNTYLVHHVKTSGDLRPCVCGSGYTCEKHNKVDGRGLPPRKVLRRLRNSSIEWVPFARRRYASRFPIVRALVFKMTLKNAGLDIATRRVPRAHNEARRVTK